MSKQKGASGSALYFPAIELPSREWALAQLLLWDRVQRIVPDSVRAEDCHLGDLVEAELVEDIPPTPYLKDAEKYFRSSLQARFSDGKTEKVSISDLCQVSALADDFAQGDLQSIHREKFTDEVGKLLKEITGDRARQVGPWWECGMEIGYIYMCCLAHAMSERMNAPLVTHDYSAKQWQLAFRKAGPRDRSSVLRTAFDLNIDWPSPEACAAIPTPQFVKWHEQTVTLRQGFRKHLLKIHAETVGITDPNEYRSTLNSHQKSLTFQTKQFREAIDELGVKTFTGAIRMSWPSAIAVAGTVLSPVLPHVGIPLSILGVGWALVEAKANYRENYRKITEASAVSYVALLQDKFA